jgi:hypothetical protein
MVTTSQAELWADWVGNDPVELSSGLTFDVYCPTLKRHVDVPVDLHVVEADGREWRMGECPGCRMDVDEDGTGVDWPPY